MVDAGKSNSEKLWDHLWDNPEDSWDWEDWDDEEIITPDGPADMMLSELLGTHGDPWGDADI